jgi:release factor glutamine methyltransferase
MHTPITIAAALFDTTARLSAVSPTPRLDAEVLLSLATGLTRSALLAGGQRSLEREAAARFAELVDRRCSGEPVAYLSGRREFWSLELEVGPAVLIPRPETELLVEQALERVPADAQWAIADLGTGSGAVALAIAMERPRCRVVATDQDPRALAFAERNRARLGAANVTLRAGAWCAPLHAELFHVIVSNPPYVCDDDPHLDRGDVRFEPRSALAGGGDGLDAIRALLDCAPARLRPGGWLLLEHGFDQAPAVRGLLAAAGLVDVSTFPDLAGRPRVSAARLPD